MTPAQGTLEGVAPTADIEKVVKAVTEIVAAKTISIPQIVVLPKKQIAFRFDDFDLADLTTIKFQPIEDGLVIQNLRTEARLYLAKPAQGTLELRLEDNLVRYLIEKNEIDYDAHSDLLYKLCGQIVGRLHSYLTNDSDVENVLLYHGRTLADFVFAQMMQHYHETLLGQDDYEVRETRGFSLLRPQPFNVPIGQLARAFSAGSYADIRNEAACLWRLQEMLLPVPKVRFRPRAAFRRVGRFRGNRREMDEARSEPLPDRIPLRRGL